ncbi:MAG: tetratricopeptide repeat protein [Candidatus Hodarchaeales archaeon]
MDILEIENMMQRGNYNRALEAIDELNEEEIVDGLILKSRILEIKGKLKEALSLAKHAIKESKIKGTKLQRLGAIISLGYCHFTYRNTAELAEVIKEGEKILLKVGNESQQKKKEFQGALHYLKGFLNFLKGDLKQALDYLQKSLALRGGTGNTPELAETITAIGWVHLNMSGKFDLALEYFQRSLAIGEELDNNMTVAHSLCRIGACYTYIGNQDAALSYNEKSLALYQELDNKYWIVTLMHNIAVAHRIKEDYSLALDYFQQALEYSEDIGHNFDVALTYSNIGVLYFQKGDVELALENLQKSIRLFEDLGQIGYTAAQMRNIGEINLFIGDLDIALDYFNKSLKIYKEGGSAIGIASAKLHISIAYNLKGETEQALNTVNESLDFFTKLKNEIGISICLQQKGSIYKLLGKFDLAIKYLEEGLELYKQTIIGGSLALEGSIFLLNLILVAQECGELDSAKKYLSEMQEVSQDSRSRHVKLRVRFAEAIVFKMSKRIVLKFQAQQKFQAIVDEEIIDHNITILAMWNLCELLILEIKISEVEGALFQEVTDLSEKMYNTAQTQNSPLLIAMALILKTKLLLVEGNVEEANNLLSIAKRIAEEKKLHHLLPKVKYEQEAIQSEFDKWEELSLRNASIQERLQQARVENYIVEAKRIQETWIRSSADVFDQ